VTEDKKESVIEKCLEELWKKKEAPLKYKNQ